MQSEQMIIQHDDTILVTGAGGIIGTRVVANLLDRGFRNLRCLVRVANSSEKLQALIRRYHNRARVTIVEGNLLSQDDCVAATKDVAVVFHLAAGKGVKSFPDAFMNSVVTTRNLLEACRACSSLRRFVNVSSFSVYSNCQKPKRRLLDETCPLEPRPHLRGDAYTFAKLKQDEVVSDYGKRFTIPYVIVRPGVVYGPGSEAIHGRVGIGTFGLFLHLGGSNAIPLTYVDNCAEAIVLAGIKPGVDGETFNVVDDKLPSSREFLRQYKKNVRRFRSIYVPHALSYLLCWGWEKYSEWSGGQLPPVYNRRMWHAYWKRTKYSNEKLKKLLGWAPRISPSEALRAYLEGCQRRGQHA